MTTEPLDAAYRAHADELTRYATALVGPDDASDVVADALLSVFGRAPGDLATIDRLRPYLFRAVYHRAVDHLRTIDRRRRRESYIARRDDGAHHDSSSVDARRTLAVLSEQQRAIIFLAYWCDDTPATIAEILGVSEGSVRKQLARARARLREVLDA